MHGYSYHYRQCMGMASATSNNGTGTFILYRLLNTHPPIYHENYPIIKPILFPATTVVSMPGLSDMSIDMGICMGAWLQLRLRLRACAWLHG